MSYVESTLLSNETIMYEGKIHFIIYANAFFSAIFAIFLLFFNLKAGIIVLCVSAILLIRAKIIVISTEMVITNLRAIAKIGLIKRETIELNHSKVESYKIDQSILGRILNYGAVSIIGTGGSVLKIRYISNPLLFRKRAMELQNLEH